MRKSFGLLLASTLVLTSCGTVRDSRLNPFNWFGRAERVDVAVAEKEINPLIPQKRESIFERKEAEYAGTPVSVVNELHIERVSDGALIRVKATASAQGAFDVVLQPANEEELPVDGVLTYNILALQPGGAQGTVRSREINVARFRTNQELAGVRTIRVVATENALQSRRR